MHVVIIVHKNSQLNKKKRCQNDERLWRYGAEDRSGTHWKPFLSISVLCEVRSGLLRYYMSRSMIKPTKWPVCPAKRQTVWSESSLSAWRNIGSIATHWAHGEDPDQSARMFRLIWVFSGRICHCVVFVRLRLIWSPVRSFPGFVVVRTGPFR